jgi:AcrR family transcriptional regulator
MSADKAGRGQNTRTALLKTAAALFSKRGYEDVSVAEIASASGAFPNQVTHHFGSKQALYVHAASHAILRTAKHAERHSRDSTGPEDHARRLVTYLLGPGAGPVMMFAEAMLMARRTPALQDLVTQTSVELYTAGESAMVDIVERPDWQVDAPTGLITRGFWTAVLGLAVEKSALGEKFDDANAEAVIMMIIRMNTSAFAPAPRTTSTSTNPTSTEPTHP